MQRTKPHGTNRANSAETLPQRQGHANSPNLNNAAAANANASGISNNSNFADGRGDTQQQHQQHQQHQQQQKGLEWLLGLTIRVKTLTDDEFEGQIYAYDPKTHVVVLQTPSVAAAAYPTTNPKYDFRVLKVSFLKEVIQLPNRRPAQSTDGTANASSTASSTPPASSNSNVPPTTANGQAGPNGPSSSSNSAFVNAAPAVNYVPVERLQQRGLLALKETKSTLARIGVGVTQEAQDIFDALNKTLPCRWAKDSIVVLDEVIISPPYNVENCKANASAMNQLTRVKKVLEGEKKRLGSGNRK